MRTTPEEITKLKPNEIFVFGSNLAGKHGKGAAWTARILFEAELGVGYGRTGRCYAIPTKDKNLKTLRLRNISEYVDAFLTYAYFNPKLIFLVTPIGCGLAGYNPADIAPMFKKYLKNVILPECFHENLIY